MSAEVTALLRRWAYGWARTRDLAVSEANGLILVEANAASRRLEYIAPAPTPACLDAGVRAVAGRADIWLTYDARSGYQRPKDELDIVTSAEALMCRGLERVGPDEGVVLKPEGDVGHARIEIDGAVAATGTVAVVDGDAVFDRIETQAAFRRRGLGRRIMAGLTAWAYEQGATTGILAASVDGQRLYERLGWVTVCPLISLRGR